ncbi:aminotransferase class I/II-fold pyridoxal phosphate-dependent enzyme [Candidatus Fermentibacteria bacterium]|nr:aminotransferase class I/II-fold pyridoxal phosphate-dependent enzyme [Candidatus Fermentibacteria bacterium]
MTSGPSPSKRVASLAKSAIHEMTRLSKQYDDVAFLSWAKPTSGTPVHIRRAAVEAIENGAVDGYSESRGLLELREEICEKLKRDNGIDAGPDEFLVTVGAIEGLAAAVMAVVDPGDEVLLPTPTYSTHVRQVLLASAKPVFVPSPEDAGFGLDVQGMRRKLTPRTRAVLLCTPCNPTGAVYSEKSLRELGKLAVENDLTVITDEAYEYFVYDDAEHFSLASVPEYRPFVVSGFTFTKTYAMTGWRLGYIHASSELTNQIQKAHIPMAICAPVVSQYAALAALRGPADCVEEFRSKYLSARNLMCERLDALEEHFSYHRPEGSYLMFPRVLHEKGAKSLDFCKTLLSQARVSATPGVAFGPTGEGHVRMSFCVPEEMINKAFDRIEEFFGR